MIQRRTNAVPNATPSGTLLEEWRSGTGKVIRQDDLVTKGSSAILYRVKGLREFPDRVEVTVVVASGKRKGTWRTFLVDDLHQVRRAVEVR